ncbi:MAG: hypothetical protein ACRD0J_18370 [Acidimicrobiales bacterium]
MSGTLGELLNVLQSIGSLAVEGRARFDSDPRQRWSIERLWIFAGNLAERHCREAGLDEGMEPWSELVATRNVYAHYTPASINYERIWFDTTTDIERIIVAVTSHPEPAPGTL